MKGGGYIYGNTAIGSAATTLTANVTTQTKSGTAPKSWKSDTKLVIQNPITSPTFGSDYPVPPTVPAWVDFGAEAGDYTARSGPPSACT
jgi:hypothetical protein